MLDPKLVERLRISAVALREVPQESPRAREFCDGLADDLGALLADWERLGEALERAEARIDTLNRKPSMALSERAAVEGKP